ncbi:MAG TPA: LysE family translocator [Gaiellaceae bacterium]|nr:LysE family translocator [Gaiellaceae bacterium]
MFVNFGAFLAISLLIAIAPGPDTALATRNALVGGRHAALFTVLGVASGLVVWTIAASIGIAALLEASEPAFLALKVAGSIYLVYLGVQALRAALSRRGPRELPRETTRRIRPRIAFRQGLICNLGNPKIAIFFTSFLPQFAAGDHPSFASLLLLALTFCAIGLTWLTAYSLGVAKAGDVLRRPRVRRIVEGLTGIVLIGFGIRLAIERR